MNHVAERIQGKLAVVNKQRVLPLWQISRESLALWTNTDPDEYTIGYIWKK